MVGVDRAARNRGLRRLYMSCLAENLKMQTIARKHEAELRFEYGEVIGEMSLLDNAPRLAGLEVPVNLVTNLQSMIFGALIIFFLILEPNGLARLWAVGKEKLRLWPFPH